VDDVQDARDLYQLFFRFRGVRVLTAPDGVEAMHVATFERPDVIVLDLAMPRMTGYDVLRELRKDPRTRHIPVVVLSGQQARDAALQHGADSYLEKPCLPDTLLDEVLRVLREPRRSQ
jgi:CheY-like chemotaxis protein